MHPAKECVHPKHICYCQCLVQCSPVFLRFSSHGCACVGCTVATFCQLAATESEWFNIQLFTSPVYCDMRRYLKNYCLNIVKEMELPVIYCLSQFSMIAGDMYFLNSHNSHIRNRMFTTCKKVNLEWQLFLLSIHVVNNNSLLWYKEIDLYTCNADKTMIKVVYMNSQVSKVLFRFIYSWCNSSVTGKESWSVFCIQKWITFVRGTYSVS